MHSDQDGGIITSWLVQLLVIMAVIGLVVFDLVAVITTAVTLEDEARVVAVRAADAYGNDNDLVRSREAAEAEAEQQDVELLDLQQDGDFIRVEVRRRAATLWMHRIPPLRDYTLPQAVGRSNWRL